MTEFRRILVPLDGSALAEEALLFATLLAKKFDSELILLRALELTLPTPEIKCPENHWIREALWYNFSEAQSYLDAREAELQQQGFQVRTMVRDGPPPEDILAVAGNEKIDLIVLSSHGKGAPSPWTAGSVANKVTQHSPCPVLLVRQNAEMEWGRRGG